MSWPVNGQCTGCFSPFWTTTPISSSTATMAVSSGLISVYAGKNTPARGDTTSRSSRWTCSA